MGSEIHIIGIRGIPEVNLGDDMAALICAAMNEQDISLEEGDIIVISQKVVSKSEGCVLRLKDVRPSKFAHEIGATQGRDPRLIEVILGESRRIVRMSQDVLITETHHGFICANAGVDTSNLPEDETVTLLPRDPDASARWIRERLWATSGIRIAVIISDTFGRPWREGTVDVALGVSGLTPLRDYRQIPDIAGHLLRVTVVADADQIASATELVRRKTDRTPAAIVRGFSYQTGEETGHLLIRRPEHDLFR